MVNLQSVLVTAVLVAASWAALQTKIQVDEPLLPELDLDPSAHIELAIQVQAPITLSGSPQDPKDPTSEKIFSKEEMGRYTWTLMHLYSAFLPKEVCQETLGEFQELIRLMWGN